MSGATVQSSTWRGPTWGSSPLSPIWFDALLYAVAALFAGVVAVASHIPLYREWGTLAVVPYVIVALCSAAVALRRLAGRHLVLARVAISALAVIGAVVVPLSCEVAWRFSVSPEDLHVQPEVTVIERAAHAVAHGENPYRAKMVDGQLHGAVPGLPAYEAFFPYLPAMTLFGLPMAAHLPANLGDARIWFLLATLLVVALALWWAKADPSRRIRAFQVALVLPWAALALATGGDDLPIVGLLLLAVVLAANRRPSSAGLVLGIASAMKFTAWPVAGLLLFAARDRAGRRAWKQMLFTELVFTAPLVAIFLAWDPSTFVANVVKFPLGVAGVDSPAGSALPGHLLVSHVPSIHHAYAIGVAAAMALGLVSYLIKRPPHSVAKVCSVAGWALLIAICLAPATRIGYLVYPANLFVWAWMLSGPVPSAVPNDAVEVA